MLNFSVPVEVVGPEWMLPAADGKRHEKVEEQVLVRLLP